MTDKIATEKEYPITVRFIFRNSIMYGTYLILAIFLSFLGGIRSEIFTQVTFLLLFSIFGIIMLILRRANFHFSLDEKYINVKQGVINKSDIHIPYQKVQNVLITQGIMDRIFNIRFLVIENFSGTFGQTNRKGPQQIGVVGNRVNIPGLSPEHAEELKKIILKRIKENPSGTLEL